LLDLLQAVADDITNAVAELRKSLEGENADDIRSKIEALNSSTMKIGEAMKTSSSEAPKEVTFHPYVL